MIGRGDDWPGARVARRFVERVAALDPVQRRLALPPTWHRDPYLSAWTNVEAALGSAPDADQPRLRDALGSLDAGIANLQLPPDTADAARRAVRALLARPYLGTGASFTFVYQPFETTVPVASLDG